MEHRDDARATCPPREGPFAILQFQRRWDHVNVGRFLLAFKEPQMSVSGKKHGDGYATKPRIVVTPGGKKNSGGRVRGAADINTTDLSASFAKLRRLFLAWTNERTGGAGSIPARLTCGVSRPNNFFPDARNAAEQNRYHCAGFRAATPESAFMSLIFQNLLKFLRMLCARLLLL